ncbi:hypothetical protein CDAR_574411 [Caerostris darwini]|uniref:Uncharacterized protein n=1 Tax=Caerostris darwini TaxID=1538125 RepID=A0AAV4UI45_9ARAC|nr:hypothetical protein CDAR_574411 [Caerostris darwini]
MASRSEDVRLWRCPSNIVYRLERECPSEDARCRALCFRNGTRNSFSFGLHHSSPSLVSMTFFAPLNVTAPLNYWVRVANFNSPSKMASRSEDVQLGRCPSNIVHRSERECPSEDARCRALCFPNGVALVLVLFCGIDGCC